MGTSPVPANKYHPKTYHTSYATHQHQVLIPIKSLPRTHPPKSKSHVISLANRVLIPIGDTPPNTRKKAPNVKNHQQGIELLSYSSSSPPLPSSGTTNPRRTCPTHRPRTPTRVAYPSAPCLSFIGAEDESSTSTSSTCPG
ncbi:hypothetical protein BO86DRAFT_155334 [Aspergillus japonicus CBS 114.51]|uniref:Uncharacterized protein n=1 Tax=Aspergillus japonicus CBS 114.51 TaxID=1448312 RepID=A0A8T8WU16_ASPJA|nr:hypothetical protein BO86DRAFT_155334 [Aspergillus japonicus CBS 114.51]RAH79283.1 hypothetical protein BO86DRAFT_155334 [Aspergillus japonicus CBS 114.51]